jgi:L-seryl-tRNA(Ser) seleniumtransferase
LLLKVHASNYRIVGFQADVDLPDLVAIGRRHGVPVMEDLGSGALIDLRRYGLPKEPVVSERISAGADIVTFSGDKLLGGPQAGLIVGASRWLREVTGNPMHRAVRCGKLVLVALEATLKLYQQASDLDDAIPTLRALSRSVDEIAAVGLETIPALEAALGQAARVSLEDSKTEVGSGALPLATLPTKVIAVEHDEWSADELARRFRQADPPIIGRVKDGRFLLDLRTIFFSSHLIPRWRTGA